jgi:DNA replication ATP-dependent helicase Dna2
MPAFKKKILSLFFRTRCQRQLHLYLYSDLERKALGMPPRQAVRSGLGSAGKAGYEWQDEKVSELESVFGAEQVIVNPVPNGKRPGVLDLQQEIENLQPFQFIVEAKYNADTDTFREAIGFDALTDLHGQKLAIGEVIPDIIQALPPRNSGSLLFEDSIGEYNFAILPDGRLDSIPANDCRIRLRIIDIKLAADPGANYFAEVVYYSMTLSSWLKENSLDSKFVVVATPAVWPGSYEASNLSRQKEIWSRQGHEPTFRELTAALEKDIEVAPVDAYAPRLRDLLCEQLPAILNTPWEDTPYHVNYSCQGCEFLGYPWKGKDGTVSNDDRHCWPTAERTKHLSQVAGLSSGAARQLSIYGSINDTISLSLADSKQNAFSEHQMLRTKGNIYPHRAHSLNSGSAFVIPDSGGDALMPRWPDLHIYIFVDYDLSSAITATFGLRAFWTEPLPFGSTLEKCSKKWNKQEESQEIFLVDRRDIIREREELLKFLHVLKKIMEEVIDRDNQDISNGRRTDSSSYQIYLWDEAQRRHLTRLVSRHLPAIIADRALRNLAWLFPPSELLAQAENSSRQSPITLISSVVQNTIAAPVAHHFTLLEIVQTYGFPGYIPPSVHPLYREPLTDLIPSERIYDYWDRREDWKKTEDEIYKTTGKKVLALGSITSRLEQDLKALLPLSRLAAPPLMKQPRQVSGLSPQGRLLYEFTRLNVALQALETHTIQAMPPQEREARFKSAILVQRLEGEARQEAINSLQQSSGSTQSSLSNCFIYSLAPGSIDINARDGDIGFALSPLNEAGFLDQHPWARLTRDTDIESYSTTIADSGLTGVSICVIDRIHGLIALNPDLFNKINTLETAGKIDFSQNVILDPIPKDFLTKKVESTLKAIGYPLSANQDPRILEALRDSVKLGKNPKGETSASHILWQAKALSQKLVERDVIRLHSILDSQGFHLNTSQWRAWEQALTRRFALMWGPPGTGKSSTLRNIVLAAVVDAVLSKRALRILITSSTYTAIDNVLLYLDKMLIKLLPEKPYSLFRLQSKLRPVLENLLNDHPDITNIPFDKNSNPQEINALKNELTQPKLISVVGSPAQQLHNLAIFGQSDAQKYILRDWFDFVVIDEASQLDVATSTLIFTKVAKEGSVILAGDDLQLPPVHQAEAPEDLQYAVGSIYNYFRHQYEIEPQSLKINYRSNETLVEFTRLAGYDSELKSHSSDLSLHFANPISTVRPNNWPDSLFWTSDWAQLLDSDYPATCFVYEDELSSQVNNFEADAIASLTHLLYGCLNRSLMSEKNFDGSLKLFKNELHDEASFWGSAVGIVTPHRAQQSKIVHRLQSIFPSHPASKIRDAVDTVERFQGQERQIILASFGLGDPDLIQSEDEFLYSLNRFNVLTSRARAKLVVFTTRTLVDHLSNDSGVLKESLLLKRFVESFCRNEQSLTLGYLRNGVAEARPGKMRYR